MFDVKNEHGLEYIETTCPKKSCTRPYRIDEYHPEYRRVKADLERGDRSKLFCYHKPWS